jgi:hypothetical protein
MVVASILLGDGLNLQPGNWLLWFGWVFRRELDSTKSELEFPLHEAGGWE